MGTNYYLRSRACPKCGRSSDEIHIGKSSAGWTFTFHATESIRSVKDWKKATKEEGTQIYDEYNRRVSYDDFWKLVESKKNEPHVHAVEEKEGGSYLDSEGNSMSPYEFS